MGHEYKRAAVGTEKKTYVTRSTRNTIIDVLDLLKKEGITEYFFIGKEPDVIIRDDLVVVDLRILPDGEFCTYIPEFATVNQGANFTIANETDGDVSGYFPDGVFLGVDGTKDEMGYVDILAGETRTLQVLDPIEAGVESTFYFLISCTKEGTGGSPKGVIQPPP